MDVMQEHYGFSEEEYSELLKSGVTFMDLFKSVKLFDPNMTRCEISKVGLFYYVDAKGDFESPPFLPHKKIAQALFNKLSIREKIEVAEYVEFAENGYVEEEEDDG